jgi:hypothetical protein
MIEVLMQMRVFGVVVEGEQDYIVVAGMIVQVQKLQYKPVVDGVELG